MGECKCELMQLGGRGRGLEGLPSAYGHCMTGGSSACCFKAPKLALLSKGRARAAAVVMHA